MLALISERNVLLLSERGQDISWPQAMLSYLSRCGILKNKIT